ncbi:MAG: hypothetical protein IT577_14070 [Verrucomicrobiae bacterium]|nr:hypothetical protein [Verrucomicrobiae bacterium]
MGSSSFRVMDTRSGYLRNGDLSMTMRCVLHQAGAWGLRWRFALET